MITSLSFSIFIAATLVAIFTGFLWQDEFTASLHGRFIRLFFGSKFRSLLTTHLVLLSGFLVFLLLSPQALIPEMLGVLSGGEVMLLAIAYSGFLNWRLGRWSFAPRHGFVVKRIIELSEGGRLDGSVLKVQMESMVGEIRKCNTASEQHLLLLESRNDALGDQIREILRKIRSEEQ
jgi:hypothetical protein